MYDAFISGYYFPDVANSNCIAKKTDGISCTFDGMCSNDVCKSTCCRPNAGIGCSTCKSDGDCEVCAPSYYRPDAANSSCQPKKLDGVDCAVIRQGSECISGVCKSACCNAATISAGGCLTCTYGSGACFLCNASAHFLDTSGVCLLRRQGGGKCITVKPYMCLSSVCNTDSTCCGTTSRNCIKCDWPRNPNVCKECNRSVSFFNPITHSCDALLDHGDRDCYTDGQCKSGKCGFANRVCCNLDVSLRNPNWYV